MPGLYEYTISMTDKASGTLQKLTGSSFEAVQKFVQLDDKTAALKNHLTDFGNGISALKQKIDILQGERDLIDPQNLPKIQQYNREIAALNGQINNLETSTGGSKMGKNLKDAFQQIPGAAMLTNPIVLAGAGVAAVSKLSMSWEDGMAKINTTAQLPKEELDKLGDKIKKLGVSAGADLAKVPDAYEKIISQTGDVSLSTDILATALNGAKAGYADVDLVAGAVGQSLSAIGKGKETAAEVMDVLFAAKRVGAGEFADFAANIPQLINAGQGVGVTFREVSGAFAYMTGKGNSAANSTMLLQNAFSQLGKVDFQEALKTDGIDIFKDGKMRGLTDIMTDFGSKLSGMNDSEKTAWLDKIGLKDMQAKQAFMALSGETDKLKAAMDATANASGEMAAALDKVNTPGNKIKEIWSNITGTGLGLGSVINSVLNPILDVLLGLFKGIFLVVSSVGTAWAWWTGLLQEGNPYIVGLTILIGGLTAAVAIHNLWLERTVIWDKLVTAGKWLQTTATGGLTAVTNALNLSMLANPAVWVVVGIMALVGAFVAAWRGSEKFRAAMTGVFEMMKGVGSIIFTAVIAPIKNLITGLGAIGSMIGKLFKKDFAGAAEDGKNALMSFSGANTANELANKAKGLGEKFNSGYQKGLDGFAKDKEAKGFVKDENGKWVKKKEEKKDEEKSLSEKLNSDETQKLLDNSGGLDLKVKPVLDKAVTNKKDDTLSLGVPQDYNQTGLYGAINQKFGAQVDMAMTGASTGSATNDPKDKPVITMASRVDEISMSLKRMAAAAAIPVAMTLATAGAAQAMPGMPAFAGTTIEQTQVDETLLANNSYDNSTITNNDVKNNRTDAVNRVSNVTNTDQGKTIRIDRFTDKIEIHIHGTDAETGQAVAQNVRDEVEKALAEILNV